MRALSKIAVSLLCLPVLIALAGCENEDDKGASGEPKAPAKPRLSQLETKDIVVGKGAVAAKGDVMQITYTGSLADGTVFDSNQRSAMDRPPLGFILGGGEMVKGLEQGILGMRAGGEREIRVPAVLGYGTVGVQGLIPPDADLYFTVKLWDVVKKGEEEVYDILDDKPGSGREVKGDSKVTIEYIGTYSDERVFDSNVDKQPLTFEMGQHKIVPGLEHGLLGMKEGGSRRIRVPYMLAYGPDGRGSVPPYATLLFHVKVLKVE